MFVIISLRHVEMLQVWTERHAICLCRQIKPGIIMMLGFIDFMDKFAKPYKTIPEQIALLKGRGLAFGDERSASRALATLGYYRLINRYQKPFWCGIDRFEKGTDFDNILKLYRFDELFRETILQHCLRFETTLKAVIADTFASVCGALGCWQESNYNNKCKQFNDFFKFINQIKTDAQQAVQNGTLYDNALCHYMKKYGDIPIWVLIGSLTLGTVSIMFQCLKYNVQKKIAQKISKLSRAEFDVDDMISTLKVLTLLRNTCAHSDALYIFSSLNTLSTTCKAYTEVYQTYKANTGTNLKTNNSGAAIIILSKMLPTAAAKRDIKKVAASFKNLMSTISPQALLTLKGSMHYDLTLLVEIVTKS